MKRETWSVPLWDTLCKELGNHAPSTFVQNQLKYAQPAWELKRVQYLKQLTQETQVFIQKAHFNWSTLESHQTLRQDMAKQNPLRLAHLVQLNQDLHLLKTQSHALKQQCPLLYTLLSGLQLFSDWKKQSQSTDLASQIPPHIKGRRKQVLNNLSILTELEVLYAKASFSKKINGIFAQESDYISFSNLLHIRSKLERKPDIGALNLSHPNWRGFLINGGHQSGKSLLLESIGMLALMNQSGLALPAKSISMPVFNQIKWCRSPHLDRQLNFLKSNLTTSAPSRLLLMDHFMSLTSPGEGFALGKAILEQLHNLKGTSFLVNYNHLLSKTLQSHEEMGCVTCIKQKKKYRLSTQEIPQHHLLEWAKTQGLSDKILKKAHLNLKALSQEKPKRKPSPIVKSQAKTKPKAIVFPTATNHTFKSGDTVFIPSLQQYAEITHIFPKQNKAKVLWNHIEMSVSIKELVPSSRKQAKKKKKQLSDISIQIESKVNTSCDLHQMRVFEAIPYLEKFLDTAYQQNESQIFIVHGKGEGTLKKAVHKYLQTSFYAASFRSGHYGEGDDGITIVELN